MKKQIKAFVLGFIVCFLLLGASLPVMAGNVSKTISVVFNGINIVVNGNQVQVDNILYDGTTYAPLREVAEMLGKEVLWDAETNTAAIQEIPKPIQDFEQTLPLAFSDGKEIYLFPSQTEMFVDESGSYYATLGSIPMLIGLYNNEYTIQETDNPFVSGQLTPMNFASEYVEWETHYLNASETYMKGKISNGDLSYEFSLEPDNQKNIIVYQGRGIIPLEKALEKLNITGLQTKVDKDMGLLVFSFEN